MKTVNIGDLKARLSAHIKLVREGQEVIVCDRNQPVARIVPVNLDDQSAHTKKLVARGILVPPLKKRSPSERWPTPPGNVSDEVMKRIWKDEREDR